MKPRLKKFTHATLPSMAKYEAILLVGGGGLLTKCSGSTTTQILI